MGNEEDLSKGSSNDSADDSKEEKESSTTGDAESSPAEATASKSEDSEKQPEGRKQDAPVSEAPEPALTPDQDSSSSARAIIDKPQGSREDRTNLWTGCIKTFEYIAEISQDKSLSFRSSDKLTTNLLIIALLGAVFFAFMPAFDLPVAAAFCYVTADIVLMAAILVFVLARIGIIRAMEPRYALVCWHLMVGTALLFLTIGFNVLAAIVLYLMKDQLHLLIGGS